MGAWHTSKDLPHRQRLPVPMLLEDGQTEAAAAQASVVGQLASQRLDLLVGREGREARQQLVQEDAERPDIRFRIKVHDTFGVWVC